jgi:hypothetical protein
MWADPRLGSGRSGVRLRDLHQHAEERFDAELVATEAARLHDAKEAGIAERVVEFRR